MWDLCNEPFYYALLPLEENAIQEIRDWKSATGRNALLRSAGFSQPAGHYGLCRPGRPGAGGAFYRSLDVISFHPYAEYWDEGFLQFTDAYIDVANRLEKPLLCTETCQGSLNDQVRGEIVRQTLDALESRSIGWLAWHLCEGKVVTGDRSRPDGNCLPGEAGYMPFLLADGLDPAASRGGAALHQPERRS